MANYYSQTALLKAPNGFRLTDVERALLSLMGFAVHAGDAERADYLFSHDGPQTITIETIRDELEDSETAEALAVEILATINLEACEDGTDDRGFDYADLYHHALIARGSDEFVQFATAHTCDKARIDGFGGSALHITAARIEHIDTCAWLQRLAEAHAYPFNLPNKRTF